MDTSGSFRCGMKNVCAQPAYGGVKDILTSVYKEGGTRALYRGVGEFACFLNHYISEWFEKTCNCVELGPG